MDALESAAMSMTLAPPQTAVEPRTELPEPELREAPLQAPEVTVLVPVLNEEGTVAELTGRVRRVFDEIGRSFELVFIDDGSGDTTVERVRQEHEADPRVKLVRLRRNFGKAAALSAGIEHSHGRLIVTMDGDLQDVPEEIPRFLTKLEDEDLDLVSGWKRRRQDPILKRWPSKFYNLVTRLLARVDLHDFNCGFKLYRREVLEQISIYGELHRYIPVLASRQGFRIGEIQVPHERRRHGASKYGWDRFYKGLLDLITVLFITKYTRRPLHLFGGIGLLATLAGFAINAYLAFQWFFYDVRLSYRPLLLLGSLLLVVGFQVLTTGLLGEMITFKNFRRQDSYSVKERLE